MPSPVSGLFLILCLGLTGLVDSDGWCSWYGRGPWKRLLVFGPATRSPRTRRPIVRRGRQSPWMRGVFASGLTPATSISLEIPLNNCDSADVVHYLVEPLARSADSLLAASMIDAQACGWLRDWIKHAIRFVHWASAVSTSRPTPRIYPQGSLFANVVGFLNDGRMPKAGLEQKPPQRSVEHEQSQPRRGPMARAPD